MKRFPQISFAILFVVLLSCQSGGPPASAEEARELLVGKTWRVADAGLLESSFREKKGDPFVHTITWLSTATELSPESREIVTPYLAATVMLEENQNPNDQSGNVAHLSGFGLQEKQSYYFTSTQEENANDRTVRLYVVSIYPDERIEKFAFTILGVSGKRILLAGPPEMQPRNLVLALEAQ